MKRYLRSSFQHHSRGVLLRGSAQNVRLFDYCMMSIGNSYNAHKSNYHLICANGRIDFVVFPLIRDDDGREKIYLVSPEHGRSYIVSRFDNGRFVISTGNGLSYSQFRFINTGEMGCGTWGMLLRNDALRDYNNGILAASYGVRTNRMHCVIELEEQVVIVDKPDLVLRPTLLQYDVACPYRISDAPFLPENIIQDEVSKWNLPSCSKDAPKHMIAAETLISNLKILHDHRFLHNAITVQNYTWALELLDFEMSSSPEYPYDENIDSSIVLSLFNREMLHTYQIIIYIAKVLHEEVDFSLIDQLFYAYGMDLSRMAV